MIELTPEQTKVLCPWHANPPATRLVRLPHRDHMRLAKAPEIARVWTVPLDDCVAVATEIFYHGREVLLSNEGNSLSERWVALDRYNDHDWAHHRMTRLEIGLLKRRWR